LTVFFRPSTSDPPSEFKQAVMDLQPDEKLWVCCLTQATVKKYGIFCREQGKRIKVYHGGISDQEKHDDFADPDGAWNGKDIVISNTCLTVAVDPKKTRFKTLFFHTSRSAGTLREGFQNICRPNRHLPDECEIVCFLDCRDPRAVKAEHMKDPRKLQDYKEKEPKEGDVYTRMTTIDRQRARTGHELLGYGSTQIDDWIIAVGTCF
jgi:hypothetical protein